MLSWIAVNSGDIVVLSVLALAVVLVIWGMIRDKKKGKHCGCSGCSGCTSCSSCCENCKKQ